MTVVHLVRANLVETLKLDIAHGVAPSPFFGSARLLQTIDLCQCQIKRKTKKTQTFGLLAVNSSSPPFPINKSEQSAYRNISGPSSRIGIEVLLLTVNTGASATNSISN